MTRLAASWKRARLSNDSRMRNKRETKCATWKCNVADSNYAAKNSMRRSPPSRALRAAGQATPSRGGLARVPHPKHDQVRARWNARCGYCGVSEEDVGGDLTVDHFVPVVAGGDESDGNLVYACFRCNTFKGEFHPTLEDLVYGRRVLHPLRDDISQHVRLEEATGANSDRSRKPGGSILRSCISIAQP